MSNELDDFGRPWEPNLVLSSGILTAIQSLSDDTPLVFDLFGLACGVVSASNLNKYDEGQVRALTLGSPSEALKAGDIKSFIARNVQWLHWRPEHENYGANND